MVIYCVLSFCGLRQFIFAFEGNRADAFLKIFEIAEVAMARIISYLHSYLRYVCTFRFQQLSYQ
jgi:hypothetical protein